jgi:hypothetical protein
MGHGIPLNLLGLSCCGKGGTSVNIFEGVCPFQGSGIPEINSYDVESS